MSKTAMTDELYLNIQQVDEDTAFNLLLDHSETLERALRRCYDKLQPLPRETPCTPKENFQRWVREMGE